MITIEKIIYSQHCKDCRDFIATAVPDEYKSLIVEDTDNIRTQYPYLSAFPTIILSIPEYIKTVDGEQKTIPAQLDYMREVKTWQEVSDKLVYWSIETNS